MKKFFIHFLPIIGLLYQTSSYAQWNTSGTNIYNSNTGYVGIGTGTILAPTAPLHIFGAVNGELNLLIQNNYQDGARTLLTSQIGKSSIQTDMDFTIMTDGGGWSDKFILTNAGKLGIGTVPDELLHVKSALPYPRISVQSTHGSGAPGFDIRDASGNPKFTWHYDVAGGFMGFFQGSVGNRLVIKDNGNVGIGTNTPYNPLEINGSANEVNLLIHNVGSSGGSSGARTYLSAFPDKSSIQTDKDFTILTNNGGGTWTDKFILTNAGNVGIGTMDPDAKLAVKGDIHAREVRVDMNGAMVPDYVFEENYNLRTLAEIEKYIDENKHLPEVPAAKEMEENGVNLGEMNMLLLKKVEELTLYVIELKKENDLQRARIETLENNPNKYEE